MPEVKIIAKNFMEMVSSLTSSKLNKLYNNLFICEAILRSLPPLAKKYVLFMLCIDEPVPSKLLEEWFLKDGITKHKVAIDKLVQLRIVTENNESGVLPRETMGGVNFILFLLLIVIFKFAGLLNL